MRDAVGARVPHGGTEAPGVVHRHCVARRGRVFRHHLDRTSDVEVSVT